MEVIKRPLTEREIKLVELGRISTNKEIAEGLPVNGIIFGSLILFFLLNLLLGRWLSWWVLLALVVILWTAFIWYAFWKPARKNARQRGEKIDALLRKKTITVNRYRCSDALVFKTWIDTHCIWALQIEPEKVLVWTGYWDTREGILPARQFDRLTDPEVQYLLGDQLSNPVDPFVPTVVEANLVGNAAIDHLEPGAILTTTLDQLLEEAKSWK